MAGSASVGTDAGCERSAPPSWAVGRRFLNHPQMSNRARSIPACRLALLERRRPGDDALRHVVSTTERRSARSDGPVLSRSDRSSHPCHPCSEPPQPLHRHTRPVEVAHWMLWLVLIAMASPDRCPPHPGQWWHPSAVVLMRTSLTVKRISSSWAIGAGCPPNAWSNLPRRGRAAGRLRLGAADPSGGCRHRPAPAAGRSPRSPGALRVGVARAAELDLIVCRSQATSFVEGSPGSYRPYRSASAVAGVVRSRRPSTINRTISATSAILFTIPSAS